MSKIKVLLIEDEAVLAMVVKETLETRGFEIRVATNGVEGWSFFSNDKPDICVVDIMMPRKDGISLVKDIRLVDEQIPIIFLTAKTQTEDVLKGLEIGADDYMKKPFSMEELILRLKNLVRRAKPEQTENFSSTSQPTIGSYSFNYHKLELIQNKEVFNLSQREADLLNLLLVNKNQLLDRKTALLKLWGDDSVFNARSMDVYITRLRKYLVNDPRVQILNIRGRGYKLID